MAISLTKEEVLKRFEQRRSQFSAKVEKRVKPELPLTIDNYEELSYACSDVIFAFLDTVFAEDE